MQNVIVSFAIFCLGSVSAPAAVPQKLNAFAEGERLIYTRVVEAYRKGNLAETLKQRDLLARNYARSVHLDNAYYLSGVLQFQSGRLAEAVRDFGVVEKSYPKSNKRPAAMFAKAMTYEKLGLRPQAKRLMQLIVKEYPGSQESQRAWMQLKLAADKGSEKKVSR